ncbi:MAG: hypothetical protein JXR83_07580 [Deltaproteobacteria bacterium]|nr:hypothetical protein [Deltaproteobacteria bacterium]
MRNALVLLATSCALFSVAGCPGRPIGPGNTDAGVTWYDSGAGVDGDIAADRAAGADRMTGVDRGCPAGQIEDGNGQCRTICSGEQQCEEDERCNLALGLCEPLPAGTCDPSQCQEGFVCPEPGTYDAGVGDGGSVACVPSDGYCRDDSDCNFTQRCDQYRCVSRAGDVVMTCTVDADCGLMMTCQWGVCVGCIDDLQCQLVDPEASCVMGTCIRGPAATAAECFGAECPDGTRCNPQTGQCEPSCTSDDDCGPGQICAPVLNRCTTDPGCTDNSDCGGNLTCAGAGLLQSGLCVGCGDSEPCPSGLRCVLSVCFPDGAASPCDDVTCPQDELCDPQNGACYPANGTCVDDSDCRPGHSCSFLHLCTGCSLDGDCRPDQRCILATCVPI